MKTYVLRELDIDSRQGRIIGLIQSHSPPPECLTVILRGQGIVISETSAPMTVGMPNVSADAAFALVAAKAVNEMRAIDAHNDTLGKGLLS